MNRKYAAADINEQSLWNEISPGGEVNEGGTSLLFNTGVWRTMVPSFVEEKCKHCMLCAPVCPDSSIPVKDGKRLDFDFMHCKGCGICYKVCPFGAISFNKEER
jgi:pyruvate ferredoxin oxidoreductase delta subunit